MGNPRDPRQMQRMMRQLGMTTEEVEGVEEVVVRTANKEHVFVQPEVSIITVQGIRTYQVVGTPSIRPRSSGAPSPVGSAPAPPTGPPEEDVTLVMEQAGVGRDEALEALFVAHGAPAEAILHLLAGRGKG
ncbi:MAG: nascent polypeptide-associated complex protein [Thermoplasmata archaeon]